MKRFCLIIIILFWCSFTKLAQTGGNYDLEFSVIANGGGKSESGNLSLNGTIGQSNSGTSVSGGNFTLKAGFWASEQLAPTAALVYVGGRVKTGNGLFIKNVTVTISDSSTNSFHQTLTNSFGFYHFNEIPVGATYIITVGHGKYIFNQDSKLISINEARNDIDFIGEIIMQ